MLSFEEFGRAAQCNTTLVDPEPWMPFRMREDFEFAEIVQGANMTKHQANALISLFHQCTEDGKGSFTLSSYGEMLSTLKTASEQLPKVLFHTFTCTMFPDHFLLSKFEKKPITVPYKKELHEFDVWVRPLWPWIQGVLQDPDLIQHFVWDACHMSKFDGKSNSWV